MENNYLIPANTKKSQLILGFFTRTDLIIFIVGVVWSFAMLMLFSGNGLGLIGIILIFLPALVATFLVLPVPHYHNVLQLLTNIYNFFSKRRKYYWKGWNSNEKFGTNSTK